MTFADGDRPVGAEEARAALQAARDAAREGRRRRAWVLSQAFKDAALGSPYGTRRSLCLAFDIDEGLMSRLVRGQRQSVGAVYVRRFEAAGLALGLQRDQIFASGPQVSGSALPSAPQAGAESAAPSCPE